MAHEKNEEEILREMQQTRVSLTEKLETLEKKVVGTVENATSAVNETVDAIKDTVHETVATVNESVKDALDVPAHVQEHPWLMLGGSVAVGYLLGTMLTPASPPAYAAQPARAFPPPPAMNTPSPAPTSIEKFLAPEIAKLKSLAVGVLFGAARELIHSHVPEHIGERIDEIVDAVTRKAGGEPLASEDFERWVAPADDSASQAQSASNQEQRPPEKDRGNGHTAARRW
jgi:ElaB/YqjD/DUF883 family membrane-anchored ribosome-binding protein